MKKPRYPGAIMMFYLLISVLLVGCPEPPPNNTDTIPPAEVSGLTATAGELSATLDWTDAADLDLAGIRVTYAPGGADPVDIEPGIETLVVTGLTAGEDYTFLVKTFDSTGNLSAGLTTTATPFLGPDMVDPEVEILNLIWEGVLESGFVAGSASDDRALSLVEVSLDNGDFYTAEGTTSWKYRLPTGADIWKNGTSHTLTARSVDESDNISSEVTVIVTKKTNKDFNGDGFADLAAGSSNTNKGMAALYFGNGNSFDAVAGTSAEGDTEDRLAYASLVLADFDGDGYADLAAGAYSADSFAGYTAVYYGNAGGTLPAIPDLTIAGPAAGAFSGSAIAAGDVNNDGYADLAVSEYGYDSATGRVLVYFGSSSGLTDTPAETLGMGGTFANYYFGKSLAFGDGNGDGFEDLAIGAMGYSAGQGAAIVYYGDDTAPFDTSSSWFFGNAGSNFGLSAAFGDINDDGYDDLAVSTPSYADWQVKVFYGSAAGNTTTGASTLPSRAGVSFGARLAIADIVDGDGYGDLIVSATADETGSNTNTGMVYVYPGSATVVWSTPDENLMLEGESENAQFGWALATGDCNLDGYADLLVAAPYDDGAGLTDRGKLYLYTGTVTGISSVIAGSWTGTVNWYELGNAIDF